MVSRALCALSLATAALAQRYDFCVDGLSGPPEVWEDGGEPSVEVIYAQAPLFSTNPKIGQKFKYLNIYHTGLVLRQSVPGADGAQRVWTLEFDAQSGSTVDSTLPRIEGETLHWDNDVRFCLTEGILWGEAHWTKRFETVATITSAQTKTAFEQAVFAFNGTGARTRPHFQQWHVVPKQEASKGISDVTCANGANWFLHNLRDQQNVQLIPGFTFLATRIRPIASWLEPVDTSNATEWSQMVDYYKTQTELVKGGVGVLERLIALFETFPCKYVYDANEDVYYKIHGNHFPYFHLEYKEMPLESSPYADAVANIV